jgi:hypothetical protein
VREREREQEGACSLEVNGLGNIASNNNNSINNNNNNIANKERNFIH